MPSYYMPTNVCCFLNTQKDKKEGFRMKKNIGNQPSRASGRGPSPRLMFCQVHQILYPKWAGHDCTGERVEIKTGLKGRKQKRNVR